MLAILAALILIWIFLGLPIGLAAVARGNFGIAFICFLPTLFFLILLHFPIGLFFR